MTINGPSGPGGPTFSGHPDSIADSSPDAVSSVEKTAQTAHSAVISGSEASQDVVTASVSSGQNLEEIIQEAARLVPAGHRAEFIELIKSMAETDPLLQSIIRRLEGGTR